MQGAWTGNGGAIERHGGQVEARLILGLPSRQRVPPPLGQAAALATLELRRELRVRRAVALHERAPSLLLGGGRLPRLLVRGRDVGGHVKEGVLGEAVLLLDGRQVGVAERRAVHARGARLGGSVPDRRRHLDQGGAREVGLRVGDRLLEREQVRVAVLDVERLPAVRLVALRDVFGEGEIGAAVDLDLIVVVEHDQPTEAQVARQRARLRGDALLHAAVAADDVHKRVEDGEALAVERRGHVRAGEREADTVREALTERPRRDLHARRHAHLRVARRLRVHLAEGLQVGQREVVSGEV